ncbi:hypothetical protein Trydic_g13530 [Trypoxylus dichotomus]
MGRGKGGICGNEKDKGKLAGTEKRKADDGEPNKDLKKVSPLIGYDGDEDCVDGDVPEIEFFRCLFAFCVARKESENGRRWRALPSIISVSVMNRVYFRENAGVFRYGFSR